MPIAEMGDVRLYYEEAGSGEAVVFVHGIPTDYRAWSAQVGTLSKRFRTVSLSRRYASPNVRDGDVSDSTVQNNAADLKGFIEKLGMAPVHLVGHSYGGFIAAYMAAEHPELLRSLVAVEPAASTLLVADQKSAVESLLLLLKSPSVALAAKRYQTRSLRPSLEALDAGDALKAVELNVDGVQDLEGAYAKMPEAARKMMLENARTVGELRMDFPKFTAEDARRISCRTLVLNGEASVLPLRRIGELLARAVPNGRRAIIPGTRHFPHMENPEVFNSQLLAFLGESA